MVGIYYESDQVVVEDPELQAFVKDVYVYGMRGRKASGRDPGSPPAPPCSPLLPRVSLGNPGRDIPSAPVLSHRPQDPGRFLGTLPGFLRPR